MALNISNYKFGFRIPKFEISKAYPKRLQRYRDFLKFDFFCKPSIPLISFLRTFCSEHSTPITCILLITAFRSWGGGQKILFLYLQTNLSLEKSPEIYHCWLTRKSEKFIHGIYITI